MTSRYHTSIHLLIFPILLILLLGSCKKQTVVRNYTVTFESNGGTDVKKQTVREGQKALNPLTPTRAGYTFVDWYVDNSFTKSFDFGSAITGNITLYAKWNETLFTVTFSSGSDSVVPSQSLASGQKATKPTANPTRAGYTFVDWYGDKGFTKPFDFANTAITGNITLYAKWEQTKFTVTFSSEGAITVPSQSVDKGQKATKPTANLTRTGYIFVDWYGDNGFQQAFDFNNAITSDTTLYAKWKQTTFTVTFASNEGSAVPVQNIDSAQKAIKPPVNPIRMGYTFVDWYGDNGFQQSFDFNNAITSDTTLYAKWDRIVYTVTFASNEGSVVPVQNIDSAQKATKPPVNPTREGYTFVDWYVDNGFQQAFDFNNAITSNTTLYAKWNPIMYKVTFSSEGAVTVPPSQNVGYKGKPSRPQQDPTRMRYTFVDWYGDNGFQQAFNFNNAITSDTTLYAKWEQTIFTVTFSSEGSVTVPSQNVDKGQMASKPSDPERLGYLFAGWYGDNGFQQSFNFANTITTDTTLYAKWNEGYIVTFDSRGGTTIKPITVAKGGTLNAPTPPTSGKLTLLDWYTESTFTNIFSFPGTINANTTLYAKYGFRVPDDIFRNKLKTIVSAAFTSEMMDVSHATVIGLKTMDLSGIGMKSLVGIEYFTGLVDLNCTNTTLDTLDVSKNIVLTLLNCSSSQLKVLNVSGATALERLFCGMNNLKVLNLSGATALLELYCHNNQLTNLDLSGATALTRVNCENNALTSLDISNKTQVTYLSCFNNQLTSLNTLGANSLRFLHCYNNKLTLLSLSDKVSLVSLRCYDNLLTSLDLRGMRSASLADALSINAGDGVKNLITELKVHDVLKNHAEIKEAKTNRGGAITIRTYSAASSSTSYAVTCNNYDPNGNAGAGSCTQEP